MDHSTSPVIGFLLLKDFQKVIANERVHSRNDARGEYDAAVAFSNNSAVVMGCNGMEGIGSLLCQENDEKGKARDSKLRAECRALEGSSWQIASQFW